MAVGMFGSQPDLEFRGGLSQRQMATLYLFFSYSGVLGSQNAHLHVQRCSRHQWG